MRIQTVWSDGVYGFREAEPDDPDAIEVADTTIEAWEAIFAADRVVQQQLRRLDDQIAEIKERREAK